MGRLLNGGSHDINEGFTFMEVNAVQASPSKLVSCDFSSDGKLLASGGHDKQAVLWYADTLKPKTSCEGHSMLLTDVRFCPSMMRLATSSFDRTVRVWDVDKPGYLLRTFTGHSRGIMSLDFHPNRDDLLCSCDQDGEIRYWSISDGCCAGVFKGGMHQVRFQPCLGRYLAGAGYDNVSIMDVETQACLCSLKGHTKRIDYLCWDPSGMLLASVSEDSVRIWTFRSGIKAKCVHELSSNCEKFYSCVFHPTYPSCLVIGCDQSLVIWDVVENKATTVPAHERIISSLAASAVSGLLASTSHDQFVKLWK